MFSFGRFLARWHVLGAVWQLAQKPLGATEAETGPDRRRVARWGQTGAVWRVEVRRAPCGALRSDGRRVAR